MIVYTDKIKSLNNEYDIINVNVFTNFSSKRSLTNCADVLKN